ncbi:hypothetical protein PHLCEN_2v6971 [Hermanssonia centrifuga]|uniref:Uncharacterized protein n=1 Tax=Hermanssonia centrifuga TaxID=98765 RepID=A0A2R6NXT7_9APHY|nr:hypothetical protein PHLCEN_2v6971 [Hermanssonia centrifuga]
MVQPGDGLIAHSSFSELVQGKTRRTPDKISDLPLAGYITSMHLVTNEKTGERRIIGGSDDGAIAIWSYE